MTVFVSLVLLSPQNDRDYCCGFIGRDNNILINVFYFNCAFADLSDSNLNEQKGSHKALLKELCGRLVNQC
jgi:hypothetical protein